MIAIKISRKLDDFHASEERMGHNSCLQLARRAIGESPIAMSPPRRRNTTAVAVAATLIATVFALPARAHQPALWPWPQQIYISGNTVPVDAAKFEVECEIDNPCPTKFQNELQYYADLVRHSCSNSVYPKANNNDDNGEASSSSSSSSSWDQDGQKIDSCVVKLATSDDALAIDSNQTFRLTVSSDPYPNCLVEADNMYGAYYGLVTLSQLCDTSNTTSPSILEARIRDEPRFAFRGFLLDTARHFLPVSYIKRVLDVLALHRYNVLHWHVVDSESFPLQSQAFPDLAEKGAFSPDAVYKTEDLADVVQYASRRGITVMPEFDVPGHGSWGKGYPSLMGCKDVLDPTNPEVYTFLLTFLKEMLEIFPSEYIFLGGDEVDTSCWLKNPEIAEWLQQHDMTDAELFDYFWQNVTSEVISGLEGRKVGVWQSNKLDIKPTLLPEGSFGNVWQDPKMMGPVIDGGMPVVLSGTYYLDQDNSATAAGPCKAYAWQQTWKCMYQEEPFDQLTQEQWSSLIGLETTMWGEGVNRFDFEARVWAKAAAVAERMWSNQNVNDVAEAQVRLDRHICRLNLMGVHAGPIIPGFCSSDVDGEAW